MVVSNTSPINYLTLIGEEHLLPALFGSVCILESVQCELMVPAASDALRLLLAQPPEWLRVAKPQDNRAPQLDHLDSGERDAILLALQLKSKFVLIDEMKGRKVATAMGLSAIGTIAVLDRAIQQGLADGKQALSRLRKTNFRASPKLLATIEAKLAP